jgi:hypothetical protein
MARMLGTGGLPSRWGAQHSLGLVLPVYWQSTEQVVDVIVTLSERRHALHEFPFLLKTLDAGKILLLRQVAGSDECEHHIVGMSFPLEEIRRHGIIG